MKMLAFMDKLHVRVSPNISGWSAALESSLGQQGFHLVSNNSLQRKLAACLHWYRFMTVTNDLLVDKFIMLANMDSAAVESDQPKDKDKV
jgi:hypothetical protein